MRKSERSLSNEEGKRQINQRHCNCFFDDEGNDSWPDLYQKPLDFPPGGCRTFVIGLCFSVVFCGVEPKIAFLRQFSNKYVLPLS